MQHKDIPDSQRHELKGASTALVGSVPVADGAGGSSFQKLGASSLSGSIPTSIANLAIVTNGEGGFKAAQPSAYGSFVLTGAIADIPNPSQPTIPGIRYANSSSVIPPSGMSCTSGILNVNSTGYYQVSAGGYSFTPATEEAPAAYLSFYEELVNLTSGGSVMPASAVPLVIRLEVSVPYVVRASMGSVNLTVIRVDV